MRGRAQQAGACGRGNESVPAGTQSERASWQSFWVRAHLLQLVEGLDVPAAGAAVDVAEVGLGIGLVAGHGHLGEGEQ